MVVTEEVVCKEGDWLGKETEGAEMVLGGGGVIGLAEDELRDGGGGRPGLDLIGGGRRGRSFILAGLERKIHISGQMRPTATSQREERANVSSHRGGRGGSEGLGPLVGSGLVWLSDVLLWAGDGGF